MQGGLKGLAHDGSGDLATATAMFNDAKAGEARGFCGEGGEGKGMWALSSADLGGAGFG